jgi:FAD/FMN-containing dehydrogenase
VLDAGPELAAPPGFRGVFRTDAEACAVYSEAAGIERIVPTAVAVPVDAEDVVTLVRWAIDARIPLTARGAGSSMANGAVGHGVIVDLYRLDAFGPIDGEAKRVVVGPAVTRNRVEREALKEALVFPVDPSSGAFATIGGMCATNAAGARSVKYGAMRRWVTGLDCVFANGARAWVRRGEDPPDDIGPVGRFLYEMGPGLRELGAARLRHAGVRKARRLARERRSRRRPHRLRGHAGNHRRRGVAVGSAARRHGRPARRFP